MAISALTKVHQNQVQQLFNDVNFFSTEWFFSSKQLFFGFFSNEQLIGVIGAELQHNIAMLKALVITKEHRNQGIAKYLLNYLENKLIDVGIKELIALTRYGANYLECSGFNQTIVEKLPSKIDTYLQLNYHSDLIIMRKKLLQSKKHLTHQDSPCFLQHTIYLAA
ncbi:GNAT family N-acetyltransferase [Fastidiosibacter lacustris]|uniref:GNAT family N-acetyltransferase n=1 Tax=Fastidiosibacter lacustris TaxID=2056695 RepID=UPI000E342BDA|nr:GNAT family N-acetyltransferase [Fastidiosibacter lacustris]